MAHIARTDEAVQSRNRPIITLASTRSTVVLAIVATITLLLSALPLDMAPAYAAGPAVVQLGDAATYSVLGGTSAANTGTTTNLSGDLGVTPAGTITGYGAPNVVQGGTHLNDAHSAAARAALLTAYNDAASRTATVTIAGDQIGTTYTTGVYSSGAAAVSLSGGTMTLDGLGDPDAVFIFQIGGALSTAAATQISLINGTKAYNVFWQVAGAVSTGATSSFSGIIMGNAAVSMAAGATLNGALLTLNGAAATDSNTITTPAPPTVAITSAALTNDTTPTISGTTNAAVGTTVTVTVGGQTLTATVSAGTWSVTAATLAEGTYPVVASVTAPGGTGTASQSLVVDTTAPTVAITSAAATNDTTPTISGTTNAAVGTTVTVTVGGQTLTTTVAAGGTWSVTVTTPLAESTHNVSVSITDAAGNTGTATQSLVVDTTIPTVAITSAAAPTISGTAAVGATLTADAGTWAVNTTFSYKWFGVGSATVLGTAATYVPTATDIGKTITVQVTGTVNGSSAASPVSAATAAVVGGVFTSKPVTTVTGVAKVGTTLTVNTDMWSPTPAFSYQWFQVGSNTLLGTQATYDPTAADVGKKLVVKVLGTLGGYVPTEVDVTVPAVVVGTFDSWPTPTVTGVAKAGRTLTAHAVMSVPAVGVTYTYVWIRSATNGGVKKVIAKATGSTYKLTSLDRNRYIAVTVTAHKSGYLDSARGSTKKHIAR